jgi:hypothetical protein
MKLHLYKSKTIPKKRGLKKIPRPTSARVFEIRFSSFQVDTCQSSHLEAIGSHLFGLEKLWGSILT